MKHVNASQTVCGSVVNRLVRATSVMVAVCVVLAAVSPRIAVAQGASLTVTNPNFSDLTGLTAQGGGWYAGVPAGWSSNSTQLAGGYTVLNSGGTSYANLNTLARGNADGGFSTLSQGVGTLAVTSNVTASFQVTPLSGSYIVASAIANSSGGTYAISTSPSLQSSAQTVTYSAKSVPAGTQTQIWFWANGYAPGVTAVSVVDSPTTFQWSGGAGGAWSSGGSGWTDTFDSASASWSNALPVVAQFNGTGPTSVAVDAGGVTVGSFAVSGTAYDFAGGVITTTTPTWTIGSGALAGVASVVAGSSGVTKAGGGTLVFSGNNSYAGATAVSAGTLVVNHANALGSTAAGTTVANGARLLLSPTTGNITVGNEALTISGTGSSGWVLRSATGANSWGGKITLAADSIIQAASGASLTLDVAAGDAVDVASFIATFNGAGTTVINDPVVGAGGVTKAGSGILTLAGNSSYSGSTTVSQGKLLVNGDNSSATGAVTVAAGATLGGSGVIGGATTVNGSLSPGNSPGELSIASLVLGGSSTSLFEINGTTRGTSYDGVTILQSSGLAYGGVLSLTFAGTFGDNTTFDLFNFGGAATGSFSSVTASGSYGSLTFVNDGFGVWTSGPTSVAGQTMTFTQSTGDLAIVPEPSTLAMLGCVAACGGLLLRRRRALAASRR